MSAERPGECCKDGCSKPRHIFNSGRVMSECIEHLRQRRRESMMRVRERNPEKTRREQRVYRAANGERLRRVRRKWYQKNRASMANAKGIDRDGYVFYQTDQELKKKIDERWQRWKGEHPDRARKHARISSARYNARKMGAEGDFSVAEWEILLEACGRRCLSCGSTEDLTADHVVPLVQGGSNWISNIQPLCQPCNSRKGTNAIDYRRLI